MLFARGTLTAMDTPKRRVHGMPASRFGSLPISFAKMMGRVKKSCLQEMRRKLANISDDDAIAAAKRLSRPKRDKFQSNIEAGVLPAVSAPVLSAMGKGVKGFVDKAPGAGRFGSARQALKGISKGDLASAAVVGAVAGSGLSAIRDSIEDTKAKGVVNRFLDHHRRH